jgi:hypothetical protein
MANTLFGAMSGVQPVNWETLIQEYVEKSISHIGRKLFFLSPYIFHLYQQYECINEVEVDALTNAEDEVVNKLMPDVELAEVGIEESSKDPVAPEPPLPDPIPARALAPSLILETRRAATSRPRDESGPSREHQPRHLEASGSSFQAS